jgi:hypothetical protein
LNTPEGKAAIQTNGVGYEQDYEAFERDPVNFGTPRLIRLGLKVNFSSLNL